MQILLVNYEYPPLGGGGGVISRSLAEQLAKRHNVTVLTSRAFDLPEQETKNGVTILRTRALFRSQMATANMASMASFVLSAIIGGLQLIRRSSFDIINSHFAIPTGPVGATLSHYAQIPHVVSPHGGDIYDPSKWSSPHRHAVLRAVIRHVIQNADAVVGSSQNTNENIRRYYDPASTLELIPLGIPRPAPAISGRDALGLSANETILITIGRLVRRKQTDQLIRVVAALDNVNVRLVIVGEGPESDALKQQVRDLGVDKQITFAGFVSEQEKLDLLAAADMFVSTSQHEGFGLVFLEAMAKGLPVICYDHGGQTDFIKDGLNGAVLPLDNLDDYIRATDELVESAERRQIIAERNLTEIENLFIEVCADRYDELFCEIIERHRALASEVSR